MRVEMEGPTDAAIMFVGDAPQEEDDKLGTPFSSTSGPGVTLNNILSQAGIARYQCLIGNVAKERPPADRIVYFFEDKKCTIPKPKMATWIDELRGEIDLYKPNIIIALGPTALWVLTGEKKLSDFRGYTLESTLVPGIKVIATHHPKAINFDWKLYFQTVLDLRKALNHSKSSDLLEPTQIFQPNVDVRTFINYMEECMEHEEWDKLAIDVETLQPGSHIEELGLSHSPDFGISVFLIKGRAPAMPENDELLLWQTFARLVKCKKIVMQNGAYDIGVLWHNQHILVEDLYMDTLIAAHVCWPELPRDLGFLGSICLDIAPWKNGSAKTQDYNPADAAHTLGISEVLEVELKRQKVKHTFDFEMSLIPVALMMQLQGIEVNRDKQKELITEWTIKRDELKSQLFTIVGREINFNSSKQMCVLLYEDLGLPIQYKRRKSVKDKRTKTTDANAIRTLERLVPDNPIFNLILAYKKADMLLRFLDVKLSPKGFVHTSYNITGAASDDEEDTKKTKRGFGRWSSSKSIILPFGSGNLQNIPPEARKMYTAKPGWKIIEADYAQAEAVVVAYLTGDQKLKQMFKDSFGLSHTEKSRYDIHKLTFAQMIGIPLDQVDNEQRTAGKTVRHATSYSAGPKVLANRLGLKLGEAKKLMDLYHKANPSLKMWYGAIQEELKRTKTLTNLFGRRHRFLDRWGDTLFRSAYSFKPQSTVGDLLNISLLKLYNTLPDIDWEIIILLQLHDAIYTMVRDEDVLRTIYHMRKCMLHEITFGNEKFTIDCDFKVKTSWAEGKDFEINWREHGENNR